MRKKEGKGEVIKETKEEIKRKSKKRKTGNEKEGRKRKSRRE